MNWFGNKWVRFGLAILVVAVLSATVVFIGRVGGGGKSNGGAQKTTTPSSAASTTPTSQSAQAETPTTAGQPLVVVNVTVTQTVNGVTEEHRSCQKSTAPPYYEILNGDFEGKVYDSGGWYKGSCFFREVAIDHLWGSGGPGSCTDNFSVIWEGSFSVSDPGGYCFRVVADGGVQLFVDDYLIIDKKSLASQAVLEHTGMINLAAGLHKVVLKYYETTGDATCRLLYGRVG